MVTAKPKKILLVDDERDVLFYLGNILKRANFEVILSDRGAEAIKLAKEKQPDLIILDIILLDINGGTVATILSEKPSTVNIPIIFLTGIIRKDEELLWRKAGGVKTGKRLVVAKPVSKKELLEVISRILPK